MAIPSYPNFRNTLIQLRFFLLDTAVLVDPSKYLSMPDQGILGF
jgi:hypothetical protein